MDDAGTGTPHDAERSPMRLFSLAEANALLPSLVPILTRLRESAHGLVTTKLRLTTLKGRNGSLESDQECARMEEKLSSIEASLAEDLFMVQALGVELKGIEQGLVDFPTMRDGRVVYLCWQLGEGTIAYWHEIDAGFSGRQPL